MYRIILISNRERFTLGASYRSEVLPAGNITYKGIEIS